MSVRCRQRALVTLKRPWLLLVWDNIGGWDVSARSRTRAGMHKTCARWGFRSGDGDFAVVRLVRVGKAGPCGCDRHRERRRHDHPCTEKCGRRAWPAVTTSAGRPRGQSGSAAGACGSATSARRRRMTRRGGTGWMSLTRGFMVHDRRVASVTVVQHAGAHGPPRCE